MKARACSSSVINSAPELRVNICLKEQDVCSEIKIHYVFPRAKASSASAVFSGVTRFHQDCVREVRVA